MRNPLKHTIPVFLVVSLLLTSPGRPQTEETASEKRQRETVHVITVEGVINPVSSEFITTSLDKAEDAGAHCLIVQLDTPGGLLESTRQITKRILAAQIPVVIYVYPQGARAASAGVFIAYSARRGYVISYDR